MTGACEIHNHRTTARNDSRGRPMQFLEIVLDGITESGTVYWLVLQTVCSAQEVKVNKCESTGRSTINLISLALKVAGAPSCRRQWHNYATT